MIFKTILIGMSLLFGVGSCFAQTSKTSKIVFKLKQTIPLKVDMGLEQPLLSSDKEHIYVMDVNKKQDTICIYSFSKNKNGLFTEDETYKINTAAYSGRSLENFKITSKHLIVQYFKGITLYEKMNNGVFSYVRSYDSIDFFSGLDISNDRMLLYSYYNYLEPQRKGIKYQEISVSNDSLLWQNVQRTQAKYIYYTHLVNKFLDVNSLGDVVYCQTFPYKIHLKRHGIKNIVAFGLDSLCSANIDRLESFEKVNENYTYMQYNTKELIYKLKEADSLMTRIQKIMYVDDTTLMVTRKSNKISSDEIFVDLWRINKNGTPRIISLSQILRTEYANYPSEEAVIKEPCFSCSSPVNFYNKNAVELSTYIPQELFNQELKMTEFKKKGFEYYKDKDPVYGLFIYDYEIR